jgi:DNA-binding NarL/FixJ family response regulator
VTVSRSRSPTGARDPERDRLSAAEQEVVECLCSGASNDEIARRLGKARGTIKNQLSSAYRKLGVRSRTELMAGRLSATGWSPHRRGGVNAD